MWGIPGSNVPTPASTHCMGAVRTRPSPQKSADRTKPAADAELGTPSQSSCHFVLPAGSAFGALPLRSRGQALSCRVCPADWYGVIREAEAVSKDSARLVQALREACGAAPEESAVVDVQGEVMCVVDEHLEPALVQRGQWLTMPECRSVLVLVPTVTYARRLVDVFSLLAGDLRVQVVFTVAPHPFNEGVTRYLRQLGISVVPWEQAVRARFDLALAAGSRGIEQVQAPLIRLGHGAGHNKPLREAGGGAAPGSRPAGMLSRQHLMHEGRVIPAAVALPHERDLQELAVSCPEALPVATVVGDPCYDRIVASLPRRAEFRRALGVAEGQQLIVVPSTWGPSSTFGRWETVLPQLLRALPQQQYQVVVLPHPNVWAGHGEWQVRSWLAGCSRHGISVVPPEQEWEALVIAADVIIGDHGSLTAYGALAGASIVLTHAGQREIVGGSPAALVAAAAPVLSPMRPLEEQLRYVAQEYRPGQYAEVAASLTSEPGCFHRRMRSLMYRMLGLGEPASPPSAPSLLLPYPLERWGDVGWDESA
jgi:hypothetical protein